MSDAADRDISELEVTFVVKLAAAIGGVAGFVTALGALQSVTSIHFRDAWPPFLLWALVVLGVAQLVAAVLVSRNRDTASIALTVISMLALLLGLGWAAFAFAGGLFSCLSMMSPIVGLGAAALAPATIGPTRRASAARRRLSDAGVELGL